MKTGHAYDDKFLKLMKLNNNDICNSCQGTVVNTAEHVIKECNKFTNIRNKYVSLSTMMYEDILKSNDKDKYSEICRFLKEIN